MFGKARLPRGWLSLLAAALYLVVNALGSAAADHLASSSTISVGASVPAVDQAEIDRLVKQLGSDSFQERKAAEEGLVKIGPGAIPALQAAGADADLDRSALSKAALSRIEDALFKAPAAVAEQKGRAEVLAFSPDGRMLACFDTYGGIRFFDTRTGRLAKRLQLLGYSANSMTFSADGAILAAGTNRGEVRLWNAKTLEFRRVLVVGQSSIYAIALSPDGSTLSACTGEGPVQLWNYGAGRKLQTLGEAGERMGAMAFSPDGSLLVTVSRNGRADAWEVGTGRNLGTQPCESSASHVSVRFCADGKGVVVGQEGKLLLWDPHSDKPATRVELPESIDDMKRPLPMEPGNRFVWPGWSVALPDCTRAASVNADGSVTIWDIQSGKVLRTRAGTGVEGMLGGGVDAVTISMDCQWLAVGYRTGRVETWPLTVAAATAATQPAPATEPVTVSDSMIAPSATQPATRAGIDPAKIDRLIK